MNKFAKLFEDVPEYGQILVLEQEKDHEPNPEVRVYWESSLGRMSVAFGFDGAHAWEKADKLLNEVTLQRCLDIIQFVEQGPQ